jgi:REP element-mobilizing transposase RayT
MSYTCLQYHIVFSTKERACFLDDDVMPRLVNYIGGIIRGLGGTLLGGNGPEDHIHLAAVLPARRTIADVLRDVKSNSSGWTREEFPSLCGFGWQDGYSAFSVSQSVMPRVVEYIRQQKEHHKKMTFEEELGRLLKQHGIDFDPRYL